MLAYAFLRERILNNNSLASFAKPDTILDIEGVSSSTPASSLNLDYQYEEMSLRMEKQIAEIKMIHAGDFPMVTSVLTDTDSETFCSQIVGQFSGK
jgi:hypothetical protein